MDEVMIAAYERKIRELEACIEGMAPWVECLKHAPPEVRADIQERYLASQMVQMIVQGWKEKVAALETARDAAEMQARQQDTELVNVRRAYSHQQSIVEKQSDHIAELETIIQACDQRMKHAAARMEPLISSLQEKLDKLRIPCQCDPPGSGELCNRCCRVRARMLAQLEPPDRAQAMLAFDNSVAEEIALWRADEAS